MKLSTKIILPIIIISALLILLNGCFGVPTDESPEYTFGTGTITGIIAAPCCNTSGEPFSGNSGSAEYWCYWCEKDWFIQGDVEVNVEVILTSGQEVIDRDTTNEFGEYTFDVPPGENYVITAYCPGKEIPLVKDVVPELVEGGSFNAGTTDLVSTSLGLVVDYVTYFAAWDPEDISLDKVMAAKPDFAGFPKFRKLIREVRRVLENCEDVDADVELLVTLCKAAEEVSESDMGCAPGFTPTESEPEVIGGTSEPPPPPPPPPPPTCADNTTAPVINKVTLYDGNDVSTFTSPPTSTVDLVVGTPYEICVYATDDDGILSQALTYSLTIDDVDFYIGTSDSGSICFLVEPLFEVVGTYTVIVNVSDECVITPWGPITVVVHDECYNNTTNPEFTTFPIDSTINPNQTHSWIVEAEDADNILGTLTFSLESIEPEPFNELTVNPTNGTISWNPTCEDVNISTTYEITVGVSDGCETVTQDFQVTLLAENCECILSQLTILTNKNVFCDENGENCVTVGTGGFDIYFEDFDLNVSSGAFEYHLLVGNDDNNLTFIPYTENCYEGMTYQWEFVGCHGDITTAEADAIVGIENPNTPPWKLILCNPPADNILYLFLGTDTYIIYIDR